MAAAFIPARRAARSIRAPPSRALARSTTLPAHGPQQLPQRPADPGPAPNTQPERRSPPTPIRPAHAVTPACHPRSRPTPNGGAQPAGTLTASGSPRPAPRGSRPPRPSHARRHNVMALPATPLPSRRRAPIRTPRTLAPTLPVRSLPPAIPPIPARRSRPACSVPRAATRRHASRVPQPSHFTAPGSWPASARQAERRVPPLSPFRRCTRRGRSPCHRSGQRPERAPASPALDAAPPKPPPRRRLRIRQAHRCCQPATRLRRAPATRHGPHPTRAAGTIAAARESAGTAFAHTWESSGTQRTACVIRPCHPARPSRTREGGILGNPAPNRGIRGTATAFASPSVACPISHGCLLSNRQRRGPPWCGRGKLSRVSSTRFAVGVCSEGFAFYLMERLRARAGRRSGCSTGNPGGPCGEGCGTLAGGEGYRTGEWPGPDGNSGVR